LSTQDRFFQESLFVFLTATRNTGKSYGSSDLFLLVVALVCADTQNNPNSPSEVWPDDLGSFYNMDKRRFFPHFYEYVWDFDP